MGARESSKLCACYGECLELVGRVVALAGDERLGRYSAFAIGIEVHCVLESVYESGTKWG